MGAVPCPCTPPALSGVEPAAWLEGEDRGPCELPLNFNRQLSWGCGTVRGLLWAADRALPTQGKQEGPGSRGTRAVTHTAALPWPPVEINIVQQCQAPPALIHGQVLAQLLSTSLHSPGGGLVGGLLSG